MTYFSFCIFPHSASCHSDEGGNSDCFKHCNYPTQSDASRKHFQNLSLCIFTLNKFTYADYFRLNKTYKARRIKDKTTINFDGQLEWTHFSFASSKMFSFRSLGDVLFFCHFQCRKKQLSDFRQIFKDHLLQQLQNDDLLSAKLEHVLINEFLDFQLSTTDGDKSTIGYINDCISRLTWEVEGKPPTIEKMKHYVFHYYNANPLISKRWTTPKELMKEKLKRYVQQSVNMQRGLKSQNLKVKSQKH